MTEHADDRHRRKDDYQPVEIAAYSNGAKRGDIIRTVAQLLSLLTSIGIFVSLIWWAASIDAGQHAMAVTVEEIRADADKAAEERARPTENQARITEGLTLTTTTLQKVNDRLDDTRDIVLRLDGADAVRTEPAP